MVTTRYISSWAIIDKEYINLDKTIRGVKGLRWKNVSPRENLSRAEMFTV